jgi:hypothetical protein
LTDPIRGAAGRWMRADGVLVRDDRGLALSVRRFAPVATPRDPYVYR